MCLPVIVTRPATQACAWCTALQTRLLPSRACHALPLITIAPIHDTTLRQGLQQYWHALHSYYAAMFVSPAAVQHFFALCTDAAMRWHTTRIRAWAVGPGTRLALLQAGVHASRIDSPPATAAQFDSEALWQQVGTQLTRGLHGGKKILLIRGDEPLQAPTRAPKAPAVFAPTTATPAGSGRNWLGQVIQQTGVVLDSVAVYHRQLPQWSADERQAARRLADQPAIWLFSSSAAVHNLAQLLPATPWAEAIALATHPRIADSALRQGFKQVSVTRPTLENIVQSLQSLP